MTEVNVEAVVEEATPEVITPEPEAKPEKKTRKPRAPKARGVEELVEEATKKMTDKEKDVLIAFLREDSNQLKNTIEALKQNIESAYAQCRELENQYQAMENFYKESLQYIDGQVIAFANAVRKSTVAGGIN